MVYVCLLLVSRDSWLEIVVKSSMEENIFEIK